MNIPVRIRSNGLIGILVSVQLVPVSGPPQLALNDKGVLVEGPKQGGVQAFGVIALRDGFAVGPLGDMQPLDPVEVERAIEESGQPMPDPPVYTEEELDAMAPEATIDGEGGAKEIGLAPNA